MKLTRILVLLGVGLLVFASAGLAVKAPKSAVANSVHDLRAYQGNTAGAYALCNFCHIAHKFGANPVNGPGYLLWNKTLSSVTTYGVYSSDTFNQVVHDISDLGGYNNPTSVRSSNLCLSCHDGTVALNSFYEPVSGATASGTMLTYAPTKVVQDVSKQHPINFTYNAAVATKAQMLVPNGLYSVDAGGDIPLYNGMLQCATCHDPHAGPTVSHLFFRPFPSQTSGTFCTYCHL